MVTAEGLRRGRIREANPMLSWAEDRPALMLGVKAGLAVGSVIALRELRKKHPRVAMIAAGVMAAGYAWVIVRNVRLLR